MEIYYMISAKVIADSIAYQSNIRLTTMQLRYPRFIHAEFMTHRVFSRNASSSRAIPVERQIEKILQEPAMPVHWGKNQKGMQALEESNEPVVVPVVAPSSALQSIRGVFGDAILSPEEAWLTARDRAIEIALGFVEAGYHKQIVNRLLEPFSHIDVLVTATEWDNFYKLRRHPDAQPEMKALADAMWEAQQASTPKTLYDHNWHMPYIRGQSQDDATQIWNYGIQNDLDLTELALKLSVARCARVSYVGHDGRLTRVEDDLALYERLVGSEPLHASPAEHCATPDRLIDGKWEHPNLHGNFRGFVQYRKTLPNESA